MIASNQYCIYMSLCAAVFCSIFTCTITNVLPSIMLSLGVCLMWYCMNDTPEYYYSTFFYFFIFLFSPVLLLHILCFNKCVGLLFVGSDTIWFYHKCRRVSTLFVLCVLPHALFIQLPRARFTLCVPRCGSVIILLVLGGGRRHRLGIILVYIVYIILCTTKGLAQEKRDANFWIHD